MKRSLFYFGCTLQVAIVLFLSCAQRDNKNDPLSPLFKVSSPIFEVSVAVDSSKVIKRSGDSSFTVVPPVVINFSTHAFDVDSGKKVPVMLKVVHNDEIVDIKENVDSFKTSLVQGGIRTFTFEIKDQNSKEIQKKFMVDIKPDSQPEIISFFTPSDTLKTGVPNECLFSIHVIDKALLIDSLKFSILGNLISKAMTTQSHDFLDTFTTRISSNDTGTFKIHAIAIDKLGRADTFWNRIVFTPTGKIRITQKPEIKKIQVSTTDSARYCFSPEVVVYSGDVSRISYFWTFGNTLVSNEKTPCTRYGLAGPYAVVLKVTDANGAFALDTLHINVPRNSVKPPEIVCLTSTPKIGHAPQKVRFELKVDDTNNIRVITWIYGNQTNVGTDFIKEYTYQYPGTYYVKVIVENDVGKDTATDSVIVNGPQATIKYSPEGEIAVGQKMRFSYDNAQEWIPGYYWYFVPDTIIQTNQNFCDYTFKHAGNFKVQLSTQDGNYPGGGRPPRRILSEIFVNVFEMR